MALEDERANLARGIETLRHRIAERSVCFAGSAQIHAQRGLAVQLHALVGWERFAGLEPEVLPLRRAVRGGVALELDPHEPRTPAREPGSIERRLDSDQLLARRSGVGRGRGRGSHLGHPILCGRARAGVAHGHARRVGSAP